MIPKPLQKFVKDARDWHRVAICGFFAVSFAFPAPAGNPTNQASLDYVPLTVTIDRTEPSRLFIGRFFEEVSTSDGIVFDRLSGPSSRLAWARSYAALNSGSIERFNANGAAMFASIGADSLRTAAMDILPFGLWEDYWQGRLGSFVAGTIGNPQEEHIDMTSISYSAVRSSWERVNEKAGMQWGIRPWRTNPYLYFLAHAGHLDGKPLVTVEGRAGYTLFGSPKIEGRVALQLPASFRIAGGASMDPGRVGTGDPAATHMGLTLERVVRFGGLTPDSVFYLGFRSGAYSGASAPRHENLFVAGLARSW